MMLRRSRQEGDRRREPPLAFAALVVGAVAASRFFALADSPGEIDEAIFAGAVTRFDLFDLSPQAPGFPVWILLGRALLPFCVTPFTALATASTLLAACSVPALYVWGRRVVGGWAALAAVVFAFALPVVWVNGGRAFSDTPATALFLVALACLATVEERRSPNQTRWRDMVAARRARLLGLAAGLLAAAGFGVRPHLILAFFPILLLSMLRLMARRERADAAWTFGLSALAGTAAWFVWLFAQAGGAPGLFASLSERTGFRARAFATGTVGSLLDSFLVRDFLSWRRALVVLAIAAVGLVALAVRRRRGFFDLVLVLAPTFLSLWFLHSRAMSRYSVPFVLVIGLAVGAGLEALFQRGFLAFGAAGLAGLFLAREAWPVVRLSAREETPPIAALRSLERWVHPGRETIVADSDFHAFLRMERWEHRLVAWGYLDGELVQGPRQMNKRLVRLADFTDETSPPTLADPVWRTYVKTGRVAEAIGNRRLLSVAVRDPAPPLFGPGFGAKESAPGEPSFRWAGPAAHLYVPADQGPLCAVLSGERPGDVGETTLRVTEAASGRLLLERRMAPGPFDLTIVPRAIFGPMPGPSEYVLSCDRPKDLPALEGAKRPTRGCFTIREATYSHAPEALWPRQGPRLVADLGAPDDGRFDPEGFFSREKSADTGLDLRWTTQTASIVFSPVSGFTPSRLILRARSVAAPVDVDVSVGDVPAGVVRVDVGLAEVSLPLTSEVLRVLEGPEPVRLWFHAPTTVPKDAGKGDDTRALGIGVDRVSLE
ncbi:MAG TPA: hypothetical protein VKS23_03580 [Thermoanaerobaculia bacterium]|nr:hypothetical protein [Thermoanaerobaculia bacterium]